jgi:hypothetical protein
MVRIFQMVAVFCLAATSTSSLAQSTKALGTNPVGTNLTEVTDYSPQLPFIDLFKISREWFTQCSVGIDSGCTNSNSWDTGESSELDLDSNGWIKSLPTSSATTIFTSAATFWDVPAEFPAGRYIVKYEGSGTINYGLGASKITAESTTSRDVININPANGGILLRILNTNPVDYLRNITIAKESEESDLGNEIFSPQFLARLTPYTVLRFMDWMRTNNSTQSEWSSRPQQSDARYSTIKGVPAEILIALSNKTLKSPWFNIPHASSDSYNLNFATLVKDTLDSSLKIYIEYSNEIWNSLFSQGEWIETAGEAAWPSSFESPFTKRINYNGKRSAEICDIWKSVFSANPERVVCTIGAQAANSWTAEEAINCPLWSEAPCLSHGINAVAIAPYFGNYLGEEENYAEVKSWTADNDGGLQKLFSELSDGGVLNSSPIGGALSQSFEWIDASKNVTDTHGIKLLAYEGGQHLAGVNSIADDENITSLFTAANRDPRMGVLYSQYLEGWRTRSGELFTHFTDISDYSKYGSWGALEKIGEISSPKYDSLYEYSTGESPPAVLKIKIKGSGRVRIINQQTICHQNCQTTFPSSTPIRLRAKPNQSHKFIKWRGACTHSKFICQINTTQVNSVTAVFKHSR